MKSLGIASDHAGFDLKEAVKNRLAAQGYQLTDFGCFDSQSVDYPDVAHPLSIAVEQHKVDLGIALCGSGNGVNMTLNKHQGIRSALCWTPQIASLARQHNNANICALPARFIDMETAFSVIDAFLSASFEGGRHQKRVDKIPC